MNTPGEDPPPHTVGEKVEDPDSQGCSEGPLPSLSLLVADGETEAQGGTPLSHLVPMSYAELVSRDFPVFKTATEAAYSWEGIAFAWPPCGCPNTSRKLPGEL